MWVASQRDAPATLSPGPDSDCTVDWVHSRVGLDGCGKSHAPGFDLRTVQPVASSYTDSAIPAQNSDGTYINNQVSKRQLQI
jgi:hypothetical protein